MDFSKIKERLDALNTQGQKSGNSGGEGLFWKPEAGQNLVRLLPNPYNKDWPFSEFFLYYKKFGKTTISPKSFGRPDPVVEFAQSLRKSKNADDWKQAYSMEPTARTYVALLVRGKENEGPKFWNFGKTVYADLLGIINDPDYGDITDLMNGRDIVVEYIPNDDPKLSKTVIRAKPNVTKAFETPEVLEKVKQMQNPETIYKEPTYDELKVMLEKYLAGEKIQDAKPESTSTKPASDFDHTKFTPPAGPKEESGKKELNQDVLTQIDSMFNDIDI